ncbi:MAG: OsmC family protein [Gemmatimonadetes bacterium]|nr:OsmC family protein [Gemmatimonadota bacterium]
MSGRSPRRPIVVTHEGGVQFAAQVRSHRIIVDQPAAGGGEDMGPAPIELLGASLGTCVALYVQQFCHSRNIPYAGMRVELEQYGAPNPNRIGQFVVRVVLPEGIPEQHVAMLERVARSCPAHATLVHGAEVVMQIEAGAPAGAAAAAGTAVAD